MNKETQISSFVGLLFLMCSCGKEKMCKKDDSFSGIVADQINISGSPMSGFVDQGQFLILTDSVYHLAFSDVEFLPPIDFSTYSLLGQRGSGSCNMRFHKDVQANAGNNTYHYTLTIYECWTFHKKQCSSYNWVLVPKLPDDWMVTFEKIKE